LSGTFQSTVPHGMLFAILGSSGVIWGACYLLWMYQKVFYGQIHHSENKTLADIDGRERISLVPLVVMAVIMGVASPYWMKSIEPAVVSTMPQAAGIKAQSQKDHNQDKLNQKTVAPALPAAVVVQNPTATGGQK
jgi:NADH-quinone oxidoreductase subunit M